MSRVLHLALILLLALTGIGLGHARGQVSVAGQPVLCAGSATTTLPGDGERTVLCPDMAPALMAAVAAPAPAALPPAHATAALFTAPSVRVAGATPPPGQARGPPARG